MSDEIIVQKYGGSLLASVEHIELIAEKIKKDSNTGKKICVVVSAMGKATNQLIELAQSISNNPNKREMDMLTSCGERSCMALLAIALQKRGIEARSLTGSQSGIITDENHSNATIVAIRPKRVLQEFTNHDVVIVAGFQGISRSLEITTLKRGGSDTTAVALAAALKALKVEIFSDVAGIRDCDPHIIAQAQIIANLSYESASGLTLYGARVLAHEALALAHQQNIEIIIAKPQEKICTHIKFDNLVNKTPKPVQAITHLRGVMRITLDSLDISSLSCAEYFLCAHREGGKLIAYVSNDIAQEKLFSGAQKNSAGLCLLTIHLLCYEVLPQVLGQISSVFSTHSVTLHDFIITHEKIFLVIDDNKLSLILSLLYKRIMGVERP